MLAPLVVEFFELDRCLSEPSVLDSPDGEHFGMSPYWLITFLFENPTRNPRLKSLIFTSDQCRRVFRSATQRGLGSAINSSEYRYIAIGISRRFLYKNHYFQPNEERDESFDDVDYIDEILDLQAIYSTKVAGFTYARGLLDQLNEIQSIKKRIREASLVSYLFFFFSFLLLLQFHLNFLSVFY